MREDTISRQAAANELIAMRDYIDARMSVIGCTAYEMAIEALREPERKKGKWLPDNRPGGGFWVCSCCKFPSEAFAADVLYKFCPNCGADMREEERDD